MKTFIIQTPDGPREVEIYTEEGFRLLANFWTRSGWQRRLSYEVTWAGIPIIQLPEDILMMQELIHKVRPDVIVEAGTAHGGTAVFYASMLELIGKGRVISIDIDIRQYNRLAIQAHPMSKRITLIEGSSIDDRVVAHVQQLIRPHESVLVVLDSDHRSSHVRQELEKYAPLVTPASYLVVFDGVMEMLADAPSGSPTWAHDSPAAAVREFLNGTMQFEVDPYYNRMGVTYCPGGFLRRKGALLPTRDRTPLVSIGLPVCNGEPHLRKALESLLAQDYVNIELIISDNASTDGTAAICAGYAARDARVRYHRNPLNLGPTANFNRVLALASGEYFMWAAHDDHWAPDYVRSCVEAFAESKAIVLVGSRGKLVSPEHEECILTDSGFSTVGLKPIERFRRYKSTIHNGNHVGMIFYGLYKRDVLNDAMPMRNVIANDHLLLAKLCFLGEFATVPRVLMVKRWGGTSSNYQSIARALGIRNQLLVRCPMLVREVLLQRLIFRTTKLTPKEKMQLSWWSLGNYIRVHGVAALFDGYRTMRHLAKRSALRARNLWCDAAGRMLR